MQNSTKINQPQATNINPANHKLQHNPLAKPSPKPPVIEKVREKRDQNLLLD